MTNIFRSWPEISSSRLWALPTSNGIASYSTILYSCCSYCWHQSILSCPSSFWRTCWRWLPWGTRIYRLVARRGWSRWWLVCFGWKHNVRWILDQWNYTYLSTKVGKSILTALARSRNVSIMSSLVRIMRLSAFGCCGRCCPRPVDSLWALLMISSKIVS